MDAKALTVTDIPKISRAVAKILMDAPEASHLLQDVTEKWSLIHAYTTAQITCWLSAGEVWVIGENQGMLSGHYKEGVKPLKRLSITLRANLRMLRMLRAANKEDRHSIIRNVKSSAGAQNTKWRKQVCKKSNYFFLDLIAIDPALKGSGAFRKLLEPILARAKREHIPVLLDTHDKSNVPLYQHFGFEIARQFPAKHDPAFIQYAMSKQP